MTDSYLPGILKWFEVVEQSLEQICPAQYACETLEKNCHQIRQMVNHYRANPQVCCRTKLEIKVLVNILYILNIII